MARRFFISIFLRCESAFVNAPLVGQSPVVVNLGTCDISKRRTSRQLVAGPEEFDGPVMVKTNLNCGGDPEVLHQRSSLNLLAQWAIARAAPLPLRRTALAY